MDTTALPIRVRVSDTPVDVAALSAEVADPRAGAAVVFTGTVRDHAPGKTDVTSLEYEAYPEQVEAKMMEVAGEAAARWPILRGVIEHRVGSLAVGEVAVCVAVSSAHRAEAFEAARYLIDELKQRVPIWKKEHWSGGAEWVEGA